MLGHRIIRKMIKQDCFFLKMASEEVKNDKEIVMEAVKKDWEALKYAGEAARNDKDIIMEAVKRDWEALKYAGEALRNDKDVVMKAVKKDWEALQYAGEKARNDKDIIMTAVLKSWLALCYAGEEARNDKEIVMIAVLKNWRALKYAGEVVLNDEEVIMMATSQKSFDLNEIYIPKIQYHIAKVLISNERKSYNGNKNELENELLSKTYDLDILNLASEGQLTVPEGYKVVDANIKEIDGEYKLTLVYTKQDNDKVTDLDVDNERKIIYNTGEHLIWQSFKIDSNGDIDAFDNIFTNYQGLVKVVIPTAENCIHVLNFYINQVPVMATGTYSDGDIVFDIPGAAVNKVKKKARSYLKIQKKRV